MVTLEYEEKAFEKLCEALPNQYCSLTTIRVKYRNGEEEITYQAYTSFKGGAISPDRKTPNRAVNNLFKALVTKIAQEEAEKAEEVKI